jgi:hypothetical protein
MGNKFILVAVLFSSEFVYILTIFSECFKVSSVQTLENPSENVAKF